MSEESDFTSPPYTVKALRRVLKDCDPTALIHIVLDVEHHGNGRVTKKEGFVKSVGVRPEWVDLWGRDGG
jgi:hypothetical protein